MPDSLNGGVPRPLTPQEAETAKAVNARVELTQLMNANKAGVAEVASMGAQIDPGSLLNGRIQVLAEMIFGGTDTPGMVEFQLRFERLVAQALEEIRGQARKAQLAAGARIPPSQVRQMAQQQGLLGPDGNPVRRLWRLSSGVPASRLGTGTISGRGGAAFRLCGQ